MGDRVETRWLQTLTQSSADEFQPLDVEELLAACARRRRRRTLAVAAATLLVLAAGVATGLPSRGTHELDPETEHYGAASTATEAKKDGRVTAGHRVPSVAHRRRPRAPTTGVQPVAASLPPAPDDDSLKPRRRAPRSIRSDLDAPALPSADELLATARAARAARDTKAARAALVEVRDRFPKSRQAGRATFLLARVELELAKDTQEAMRWFQRYLDEYPRGALAAQARGRVLQHLADKGDARAEAAASEYLRHHVDGPYAELARSLCSPE